MIIMYIWQADSIFHVSYLSSYRKYLMHSLLMDPPGRDALSVRTQLYGDNKFLIHRYIHFEKLRVRNVF